MLEEDNTADVWLTLSLLTRDAIPTKTFDFNITYAL